MRAVGLTALLFGALAFLFPYYHELVPFIRLEQTDRMLVGGLLTAVGALTLAIYR